MKWLYTNISDISSDEYSEVYRLLSPSRKERVDRLKHKEARMRSLAGEFLLEKLLREQYGITDAQLTTEQNGKPTLCGADLFVSIAHCEQAAVCAASDKPIGIDVERIRPMNLSIAKKVCVDEETKFLFGRQPTESDFCHCEDKEILARFFEIWTAKEAYFKMLGTGITNLKSINILPLNRQIFRIDDYLIQIIE